MNDQSMQGSTPAVRHDPQATAQLNKALDQLLATLDKSKSDLLKTEVLATIDRAVAW